MIWMGQQKPAGIDDDDEPAKSAARKLRWQGSGDFFNIQMFSKQKHSPDPNNFQLNSLPTITVIEIN